MVLSPNAPKLFFPQAYINPFEASSARECRAPAPISSKLLLPATAIGEDLGNVVLSPSLPSEFHPQAYAKPVDASSAIE